MLKTKKKTAAVHVDFQTPMEVAEYMVSLLPPGMKTILEPTPGAGNLLKALKKYPLISVTAPKDYWKLDKTKRFDAIVSNMPFSTNNFFNCPPEHEGIGMKVSYEQMKVLMEMSDNLILLMPWFTIVDSDVRLRAIKNFGLISVTALPRKTFNYARIQTCILQFKKGYKGKTEFKVFDCLK